MGKVNCFGIPDTYRGWTITQGSDDRFFAANADHQDDDRLSGDDWDELRDEIDNYTADNGQFGMGA